MTARLFFALANGRTAMAEDLAYDHLVDLLLTDPSLTTMRMAVAQALGEVEATARELPYSEELVTQAVRCYGAACHRLLDLAQAEGILPTVEG